MKRIVILLALMVAACQPDPRSFEYVADEIGPLDEHYKLTLTFEQIPGCCDGIVFHHGDKDYYGGTVRFNEKEWQFKDDEYVEVGYYTDWGGIVRHDVNHIILCGDGAISFVESWDDGAYHIYFERGKQINKKQYKDKWKLRRR